MTPSKPVQRPMAITNGRLVLPHALVTDRALLIENGKILGFAAPEQVGAEFERVDAGGRYITPGLIDIHTHGALGHSFNEPDEAAWEIITAENLRRGVTSLLATLGAAPMEELVACLALAREWRKKPHAGSQVLGVHSEGPFLSMGQKGAQNPRGIQSLEGGAAEKLLAYADVLTIADLRAGDSRGAGVDRPAARTGHRRCGWSQLGVRLRRAGRLRARPAPYRPHLELAVQRDPRRTLAQARPARGHPDHGWSHCGNDLG